MKTHARAHKTPAKDEYRLNLVFRQKTLELLGQKFLKEENKTAIVIAALKEHYERQEKEEFQAKLELAYRESAAENKSTDNDWDNTVSDGL